MATEYLNNKTFQIVIAKFQQVKRDKNKYNFLLEDLRESCKRKGINSVQLKEMEEKYAIICADFENFQNQLAVCFQKLAENISRYAKFSYADPDDSVQDSILICFEKIDRFDVSKGAAFNFFTTIQLNQMRQSYRSAKNYSELKKKYQRFRIIIDENPQTKQKNLNHFNNNS